ncbi:DNA polymerase, partial [Georgenia sp. 10Sc9-8]|nr:DNA polymerase [Georgenia halotolerans]
MTSETPPRLLLIDGHSMAFRAFFALPVENFSTSTGQPTNAVYGFTAMLIKVLAEEQPTHVAVAFDAGRTTFRTEQYAEYKATRDATPEPFTGQVPLIQEVLEAMNVAVLTKENIEADDILATLAGQAAAAGQQVLICSGDRDTFQLVTDQVTVLYPVKGVSQLTRMTPEAVREKYGVPPARYPDLAALVGETSDNLPGVPGVGPKTAAKWITAFDGLDNIVARVNEVTGKAGQNLRDHLDQVIRNRSLNQLLTDVELPLRVDDLARRTVDRERVHGVFDALQFDVLRQRLFETLPEEQDAADSAGFDVDVATLAPGALETWLTERSGTLMAVDVTGTAAQGGGDAWALAVADGDGQAVILDLTDLGPDDDAALGRWLADPQAPKTLHEAKVARHALEGRGLTLEGVTFDTALAAYLCHPDQRRYALTDLTVRHLHRELRTEQADAHGQGMLSLDDSGTDELAGLRAVAVLDLTAALTDELADRGADALLRDIELPVQGVLARMERAGIAADADVLEGMEKEFGAAVQDAAQRAYDAIGHEVNLSSPKQLQEVLFTELDMPRTKRTKTGWTTDADALADLYAK